MRILKIAGVIFGFLLAIFILLGVFVPSFEYENSVTVNAGQASCWSTFHDVSKMKSWMEGLESLSLKSGESMQLGSVYEMVMVDNGERMVMNETITDITPGEQISYNLDNDVLNSVYTFTFHATNDHQTIIRGRYKVTGNNLLWRSILFLSKSYIRETGQKQLNAFKEMIEKE